MDERCYVCLPSSAKHVRVCVPSSSGERVACILKYSNITPLILPKSSCNEIHMFSFNVNKSNMFSLNVKTNNKQSPKSLQPHDLRFHSSQLPIWLVVSNICIYIYGNIKHVPNHQPSYGIMDLPDPASSGPKRIRLKATCATWQANHSGKKSLKLVLYELYMGYIWVIYIYIPQP